MDTFTFVILLVYLLATGYLGYQGYRQTKNASDYLVAGRNANPVVMALSYGATFISTAARFSRATVFCASSRKAAK